VRNQSLGPPPVLKSSSSKSQSKPIPKGQVEPIVPIEQTKVIPTSDLAFDKHNPRLMTGDDYSTSDDASIITAYREIAALDELIASICANTYINLEPLIVIGQDQGPFTVLEGNRRLAAIKLIGNPALAAKCKISLPKTISANVKRSIEEVLVYRVAKESDAEAFIGFKHINGPHRWDAYAKARFVFEWYKRERKNDLSIESIAQQTGDTNNTIKAYISSMFVLEQAQKQNLFDISDRFNKSRFAFSHLYTALGRKEYLAFLGLKKGWDAEPSSTPIAKSKLRELGETLKFMYGSRKDDVRPLVESQNPDLKHLGECLVNETALSRIRSGDSLTVAYSEIDGPRLFGEALVNANTKLENAIDLLPKYDGDKSLLSVANDILTRSETIQTMMEKMALKQKKSVRI
jgi:hypothetical protein